MAKFKRLANHFPTSERLTTESALCPNPRVNDLMAYSMAALWLHPCLDLKMQRSAHVLRYWHS